jgi:hypothetical protein
VQPDDTQVHLLGESEPASRSVIENREAGLDLADVPLVTISGYRTAACRSRYTRQFRTAAARSSGHATRLDPHGRVLTRASVSSPSG